MHLLTHQAISRGIGLYLNDQAEFDRLFRSIASQEVLASWRGKLVSKPPEIRLGHLVRIPETVDGLVSVSLMDEETTDNTMGLSNLGNDDVGAFVKEIVEVRILGLEEHTVTALHQIVKACMYRAQKSFLSAADCFQVDYEGASGIALEDEQRAEDLGLYVRFLYFEFYRVDRFPLRRIDDVDGTINEIRILLDDAGGSISPF